MTEEKLSKTVEGIKRDKNKIVLLSSDIIFKTVFTRCQRDYAMKEGRAEGLKLRREEGR